MEPKKIKDEKGKKKEGGEYGIIIGSGLASAICGVDKDLTAMMVWNRILRRFDPTIPNLEPPPSEFSQLATEHGIRCEPLAAEYFKKLMPQFELKPGGYWLHEEFPELYVDCPDRLLYDKEGNLVGLLEIKCPYGKLYTDIPPKYLCQCQYHLDVVKKAAKQVIKQALKCYFLAVKYDEKDPEKTKNPQYMLIEMERSKDYKKWMWPKLRLFSNCLMDKDREKKEPDYKLLRGAPPFVPLSRPMV